MPVNPTAASDLYGQVLGPKKGKTYVCPKTGRSWSIWQILVNDVPNHRWRLTRKALSAAVAASEGQCLGSCPRSAKISMSSQDDLGQGPACSALAMDPKPKAATAASKLGGVWWGGAPKE